MRTRSTHLAAIAAAVAFTAPASALAASAGDLDPAFNNGTGKQTLNLNWAERGEAAAVQPDGKIVVAGGGGSDQPNFVVARYNADGSPDTSFDADGVQTVPFGRNDFATALALDGSGRIVVVGYTNFNNPNNFAITRLNGDGSIDKTFSNDGTETIDFGGDDRAQAVVLQGKRIVVGGKSLDAGGNDDFTFVGLTDSGGFDPKFNADGVETIDFGGVDELEGLAVSKTGNVLAVGHTDAGGNIANPRNFAIAQLGPSGFPDGDFDHDGAKTIDLGSDERAEGVAFQSDGQAIVAGTRGTNAPDYAAIRVDTFGRVDSQFGGDGVEQVSFGDAPLTGNDTGKSVAVTPDDRIVLAGITDFTHAEPFDFGVAVLTRDGFLDRNFSGDGRQLVDFGRVDEAFGVAVGNGRAYVAGVSDLADDPDLAVASLLLNDLPEPSGGSTAPTPTDPVPGSAPTPPAPDTTAPVIGGLKISPKAFKATRGGKVTFSLSENAQVRLVVQRLRKRGTRSAFASFARIGRAGTAGANKLTIKRRIGSRRLKPGSYRLTLVATDAAGNRSKAVRAKFRVR